MDADGSNKRQITHNGEANFAPFWHPDNRRVIFASNHMDPKGANFDLFLVDVETGALERVTYFERTREGAHRSDDFDGFPMFTHDGKRLVFCRTAGTTSRTRRTSSSPIGRNRGGSGARRPRTPFPSATAGQSRG